MVWCIRCAFKGLITSQTPLSWRERHPKQIINGKHTSNISLPMQTSKCHQVPSHIFKNDGSLHIVMLSRTLQKMLNFNTKYSPFMENRMLLWEGGPNMEGWKQLVTFKHNHVKMTWAFINIMNVVHHTRILHNDLLKDLMLHFSFDKLNVVYIGMCNWGEVECL